MPLQHSLSAVQEPAVGLVWLKFGVQHSPLGQMVPLQHWVSLAQEVPFCRHPGVVVVEVVLVVVDVVGVVVVVVLVVVVVVPQ